MTAPATSQAHLTAAPIAASRALSTGAWATVSALVLNLLAFALGTAAGAEMVVTQPGADASTSVTAGNVAIMTFAPIVLGVIALVIAGRWGTRGWRAIAWLGLVIGVVSVAMPFSTAATADTHVTLASMHLLTGLAWFLAVRLGLARVARAAS